MKWHFIALLSSSHYANSIWLVACTGSFIPRLIRNVPIFTSLGDTKGGTKPQPICQPNARAGRGCLLPVSWRRIRSLLVYAYEYKGLSENCFII